MTFLCFFFNSIIGFVSSIWRHPEFSPDPFLWQPEGTMYLSMDMFCACAWFSMLPEITGSSLKKRLAVSVSSQLSLCHLLAELECQNASKQHTDKLIECLQLRREASRMGVYNTLEMWACGYMECLIHSFLSMFPFHTLVLAACTIFWGWRCTPRFCYNPRVITKCMPVSLLMF